MKKLLLLVSFLLTSTWLLACDFVDEGLVSFSCNGNDVVLFTLNPEVTGSSSSFYNVSAVGGTLSSSTGFYGQNTAFLFQPSGTPPDIIEITLTDPDGCSITFTFDNPCTNPPCEITDAGFISAICVGTNGIEFTINPTGTGLSNTYFLNSTQGYNITPSFGSYGGPETFTLVTIGPPPTDLEITITDQSDNSCSLTFSFPNPCVNDPCDIQDAGLANVVCNDAGTPSDPSDDFITFSLNPTGTDLGTQYNVSLSGGDINPNTGTYGFPNSFTILAGSFGNNDFTLTITDIDDPNCSLTITVPNPCANLCSLNAAPATPICDDNGTPSDPSDDTFTFSLTVSGNGVGSNGWIANDPNNSSGGYGNAVILGPYPISGGPLSITITDVDNPGCTTTFDIAPPAPCSDQPDCNLTSAGLSITTCNDNGTPNDPSDDFFEFSLDPQGDGLSDGYTVTASAGTLTPAGGNYGGPTDFDLTNVAPGTGVSIIITDNDDPNCTTNTIINLPPACSDDPVCDISFILFGNVTCLDNGTPNDPSDDLFTFEVQVTGDNTGSGWQGNDPQSTIGNYDELTIMGPYPISGGGFPFFATDLDDPNCSTISIGVVAPDPCSDAPPACNITNVEVGAVLCNDNGTPFDPSDDFITFDLNPTGENLGSGYSVATDLGSPNPVTAAYGGFSTFQLPPGSAGASNEIVISVLDLDNPGCDFTLSIPNPGACATPCDINPVLQSVDCDDNGSPTIPADDQFFVQVLVNGTGSGWFADDPANSSGAFGTLATFGPFPISGGPVAITISSQDDPGCQEVVVADPPPTCSELCDIQAVLNEAVCDDNGTPSDPSDDLFTANVTITGTGTGWTANDPAGSAGTFGQTVILGPFAIAAGPVAITFTSIDNASCQATLVADPPASCSQECAIEGTISSAVCDDNGTPGTSADDTFIATLTVTGQNASPSWTAGPPVDQGGPYGQAVAIGPFPTSQGDLNFTVTDDADPACTATVFLPTTGGCSAGCPAPDTTLLTNSSCNPTDTGTVVQNLVNAAGCDSLVIETTTLLPSDTVQLFSESCNPADTGVVETLLQNQFGCDSLVIETTSLLPSDTILIEQFSCNPADTGTVEALLQNQFGCDSLAITQTNFRAADTTLVDLGSCNPADTGVVETLLQNQFGCDSLVIETTSLLPSDTVLIEQFSCNPADTGAVEALLQNQFGCDSLVITATNFRAADTTLVDLGSCNPADTGIVETLLQNQFGCDSLVIETTSLLPSDTVLIEQFSCNPADTGAVEALLQNQFGCDSLVITQTGFRAADTTLVDLGSCNPADTGVVETLLQNQFGCDSLVIETTTLLPGDTTFLAAESCNPADTGVVETLLQNQFGCDSLVIETTTLLPSDTTQLFSESCNPADTGVVETLLQNQFGCDSLVIETTTLLPGDTTQLFSESCNPADTGVVETLLQNQFGCDSLIIETTTLLPSDTTQLFSESCNPADTGVVETLLQNQFGCDSLVIETTTLLPSDTTQLFSESCNPADTGVVETLLQNQFGCDSLVIEATTLLPSDTTQLFSESCNPADTGVVETLLQNQFGCDSLVIEATTLLPGDTTQLFSESCNPSDIGVVETLLQNQFGCDSLVIEATTLLPSPETTLTPTLCFGDSLVINGTLYGPDNPSGTDTLAAENGCDSLVSVSLQYLPAPEQRLIDTVLCEGGTLLINGQEYSADNPAGEQRIQGQSGCDSILLSVQLQFSDPQLELEAEAPPCSGLPGQIRVLRVSNGIAPYRYALQTDAPQALPPTPFILPGLFPDTYTVRVTDAIGCEAEAAVVLPEGPEPVVELGADIEAELGDSIRLNPQINFAYDSLVWTPPGAVSCAGCPQPSVIAEESVTINLLAFDSLGCQAEDDILILLDRRRRGVYVPNVFSPNGDGRNDAFTVYADPNLITQVRELRVFTRWGEPVFRRESFLPNNPELGWDGRFRGEELNPGVFVFWAELERVDGSTELVKGDVTLLR